MIIFIGYSVHFLDILGEYLVYCQYEFSNLKILSTLYIFTLIHRIRA